MVRLFPKRRHKQQQKNKNIDNEKDTSEDSMESKAEKHSENANDETASKPEPSTEEILSSSAKETGSEDSSTFTNSTLMPPNISSDSIYEFYSRNLFPALCASIPILLGRMSLDFQTFASKAFSRITRFLLPAWLKDDDHGDGGWNPPNFATLWQQLPLPGSATNGTDSNLHSSALMDFMLKHFDEDGDGHISASELLHMQNFHLPSTLKYPNASTATTTSWLMWFQRAWPMMDWKLGVFLWRSCGGLLFLIVIATIVPGRLHGISGRILRWPILALTYFMIAVELIVYIIIRLFIRLAEATFAKNKHRKLRRKMAKATSYEEWYELARALDVSQGRTRWQKTVHDDTAYHYNWSFIKELMADMRMARQKEDPIMALAVLQQCTRKNVGGIMSEDLFSYTNTGEPKEIVKVFVGEVVTTLRWVTEEARKQRPLVAVDENNASSSDANGVAGNEKEVCKKEFKEIQEKVTEEENKLHHAILAWATNGLSSIIGDDGKAPEIPKEKPPSPPIRSVEYGISEENSPKELEKQQAVLHRETLKTFLKRARAAYGRTALCLSGGAMMGNYHFGHVKTLLKENALPHIISGTSAGSVVGAVICTRTDEEIERDMRPEILEDKLKCFSRPWLERAKSVYENGHMFDQQEWEDLIRWFTCGDMTFEEAYRKTGRVFCITLSATTKRAPPVLLNYITAPNVVIASAVIASAAVPGFIPPVLLKVKDSNGVVKNQEEHKDQRYWDGSIEQDIPTTGLREMLNCQFFVAAQCNPHIVPFFYNSKGMLGRPSRWSSGMRSDSWRGGFLLSALELYLKADMIAKFCFLDQLDVAVGFTGTLMTQQSYTGSTTIVPQLVLKDFFKLFSNPNLDDMHRYFHGGCLAAYPHCAMIKVHFEIAHALDECLALLEVDDGTGSKPRRRLSQFRLAEQAKGMERVEQRLRGSRISGYAVTSSALQHQDSYGEDSIHTASVESSCSTSLTDGDDEHETGGFDGVECTFTRKLPSDSRT